MREDSWTEIRIGDLGEVFTGRTPSTQHPSYFGDDYPFITPGDMRQGKYARATGRSVSHEGAELLKRIKVPANSVCVSCIGWQMGETIMTDKPSFTNQQINTIVPNGKVEPSFLYYSLRPRKQELLALGAMTGVRTPILNKSAFCDLKLKIPLLPVQRRIAGILSAYDELMENSQQRIRLLEAMARALYREWFVHFRFPGHEKFPRISSPLGDIPEGWVVKPFGEIYDTTSGGTPSRKQPEYFEGGSMDWVKSQELLDGFILSTEERITEEALKNSSAKVFPANTVLIALYGATIGKLGILAGEAATNQACCAVLPKHSAFGREFAFLTLLLNRQRIIGLRLGAAQQNISQILLRSLECVKPPDKLVSQFSERTAPLFDVIHTLQRQIQNLRRTRDLLLPRLLSGQVELAPSNGKETNL
jgi:type I restriction enzyme, S subunit